jgi:hypothetical protein
MEITNTYTGNEKMTYSQIKEVYDACIELGMTKIEAARETQNELKITDDQLDKFENRLYAAETLGAGFLTKCDRAAAASLGIHQRVKLDSRTTVSGKITDCKFKRIRFTGSQHIALFSVTLTAKNGTKRNVTLNRLPY